MGRLISEKYKEWEQECDNRFLRVKNNEEKINAELIRLYGLESEESPEVNEDAISIYRASVNSDIRSLISYAVGCMFGRYSLDHDGISFAGGRWDDSLYATFAPDKDAIIPICDDEYFQDDMVGYFVKFIKIVYGEDTLEENLRFISDALGGVGSSRTVIRNYFINDFYADHLKIYQKRPIYWLFDAGKKNSFKCLIYLHRYRPDTVARIRTDYVHEMQSRYRTAMDELGRRADTAAGSERVKLQKQLQKVQAQDQELRKYEEKIHHYADMMLPLDLDDGVKVNYAKLQDVLAPIR